MILLSKLSSIEISGILLYDELFTFIHSFVVRKIRETPRGSVWPTFRECRVSPVLEDQ